MTRSSLARLFRRALALATAVLVLVAFGIYPKEPVRRLLGEKLRSTFGPNTRLGGLDVFPAGLRAEIRDLAIETPSFTLRIPRGRVVLGPSTFLGKGIVLRALEVERPELVLRPAPATTPPASTLQSPLAIQSLRVSGGAIFYRDPSLGGEVVLRGVDARGSVGTGVLTLTATDGAWARPAPLVLGPARVVARLSPRLDLHLDTLELRTAGSRLDAEGDLGRPGAWKPDLEARTELSLPELSALLAVPHLDGSLRARARVTGSLDRPRVELSVASPHVAIESWHVYGPELDAKLDGGEVKATLRAAFLGGHVTAETRFQMGPPPSTSKFARPVLEGRADLISMDPSRLLRALGVAPNAEPLAGRLRGRLLWSGDPKASLDLRARLEAELPSLGGLAVEAHAEAFGGLRVPERTFDLAWSGALGATGAAKSGNTPVLEQLRFEATGIARGPLPPDVEGQAEGMATVLGNGMRHALPLQGSLRLSANETRAAIEARGLGGSVNASMERVGDTPLHFGLRADTLQLESLVPNLQGRLSASAEAWGSLDRPSGHAEARVSSLRWHEADLGDLGLRLEGQNGVGTLSAEMPALHAQARGAIVSTPSATLTAAISLDGFPLAPLGPALLSGRPLEGTLSGRVDVRAPLASPREAEVQAHVERLDVASAPWQVAASKPFEVGYAKGRLQIDDLQAEGSGLHVSSTGSVVIGDSGGVPSTTALDLHAVLTADLQALPLPEGWRAEGTLRSEATVAGTLARPSITGAVTFTEAAASGPRLPPIRVSAGRIELGGDNAVLPDLTATVAGGTVRASGVVPFPPPFNPPAGSGRPAPVPIRLRATWQDVEAAPFVSALRPGGTALQAALSGELEIEGPSWSALQGRLDGARTPFRLDELSFELAPFSIRIEGSRVHTEGLTVASEGAEFTASGGFDLGGRTLDLAGKGTIDLRVLSPLLANAGGLTGSADVDLVVRGGFDAPRPRGTLHVRDGAFRLRMLAQALTAIETTIVFDETAVRIQEASADFGGGRVVLSGGAKMAGASLAEVDVRAEGRDLALRYPVGLSTRLDVDLTLTGATGSLQLSGDVKALRGLYDLDIVLQQSARAVAAVEESPLLRKVALDLAIHTENPIRVRGNLADLRVAGDLRLRGDLQEPAPFGRLEIQPLGKLNLQGQDFEVTSGRLVYEGTWDPQVALDARKTITTGNTRGTTTEAAGARETYRVTVSVEGSLSQPIPTLRSEPSLSESEILGLIATGRVERGGLQGGALLAGDQAASLLAGRLSRGITEELKGLGLDEVTIQPELLAREKDPGARFTFRKDLTRWAGVLYSLSLNNPEDRFVRLEGRPGHDVTAFGQREDDGSLTVGAGQRLRLGGTARKPERFTDDRVHLEAVRLEGPMPLPEERLRGALRARAGRHLSAWEIQEDADRLRRVLRDARYLEAEIGATLEGTTAVYRLRPGLPYVWRVEGMKAPPSLDRDLNRSLFEDEALDRGRERVLGVLHDRGHLRAEVETRARTEEGKRVLVLTVRAGPLFKGGEAVFPGAVAIGSKELLRASGGLSGLLSSPDRALEAIRSLYRRRHYLTVRVDPPQLVEAGGRLTVTVPVYEGPQARIASVRLEGTTLPLEELTRSAGLPPDSPADEALLAAAVQRLRNFYLTRGYGGVRVVPELAPAGADYALVLRIAEGERQTVGSVVFAGLRRTRLSLVRRQVNLKPGDPLDPRKLSTLERRLLALGVFSRVYATVGPGDPAPITVNVEEDARFLTGYDLRYNPDNESSARVDGEVRNLLGLGLAVGGRYSLGTDVRESRGSIHVPSLGFVGDLTLSAFRLDEDLPGGVDTPLTRVQEGVEVQGKRLLPDRWTLLFGYRFRRVSLTDFVPIDLASIDLSLLRDSRDNVLDARRGRFWSLNLELSPRRLGSDASFVKGYGQAFFARSLGARFTWAHGYRLGLAHVFDDEPLPASERFKAGGANTLRGFPTDSVGPRDFLDDPSGGQAVLILNQELRVHGPAGLGAVVFYDAGNVFTLSRDLGLSLRHVLGTGLRWSSPVGLLRFDVGFPLNREAGERRYRLFFSLGQAF